LYRERERSEGAAARANTTAIALATGAQSVASKTPRMAYVYLYELGPRHSSTIFARACGSRL
jgi:hypothetical protein